MGRLRDRYEAWWACRNATPLLWVTAWDGAPPWPPAATDEDHWLDFPARLAREMYAIEHTVCYGDASPFLFLNFGPGVLAAFMGASYAFDRHTFWCREPVLRRLDALDDLRVREDNHWLRRVLEYTALALDAAQGRFLVSLTDLGGYMDILAGLRGTEALLMDLVTDPDGVRAALRVIEEEWLALHGRMSARILERQGAVCSWNGIPAWDLTYTAQNDFSCMISPAHFREFDAAALARMADGMPCCMYHLDGPGAIVHLDALLEIENLRAIQWIPGSGSPGGGWPAEPGGMLHWLPMLRRIQAAGKGIEIYVNPADVRPLMDALAPEGLLLKVMCASADVARGLVRECW